MDRRIENSLEDYLRGSLEPNERSAFEQALAASGNEQRREIEAMQRQSNLIRASLKAPDDSEPSAGFYARVMQRIEAQRGENTSIWSMILEPQFFRRIALASGTLLVLLGVSMFTTEQEPMMAESALDTNPAAVMAGEREPLPMVTSVSDPREGRNALLVDLTTYQE